MRSGSVNNILGDNSARGKGGIVAWRKQESHRAETKAVKQALSKEGINAKVGHGKGTAWGWLHIEVQNELPPHERDQEHFNGVGCSYDCEGCKAWREIDAKAIKIAQEVTGRHGDYQGEILIERKRN